jgi:hypothetical protein
MIELVEAAAELQAFCEERDWGYCFIGGLALQHWGEPRLTLDVDATLLTGIGWEAGFIDALLARFPARVASPMAFALRNRVLLLRSSTGIPLDVALGALPFEAEAVRRSQLVPFGAQVSLRLCSAEDLIVMKAFADRDRDWLDIEGVLVRQGTALDWTYIRRHLTPLAEAKEAPRIVSRLETLRLRVME